MEFKQKNPKPYTAYQNLYCVHANGIWWVKEQDTRRTVSWSLNKPDKHSLLVLSRAVSWQFRVKPTADDFWAYRGIKK